MKKFATFLVAGMVAATASGALLTPEANISDIAKYNSELTIETVSPQKIMEIQTPAVTSRVDADITGNWVGMFFHPTYSTYAVNNFSIAADGNGYTISNFWNQMVYEGIEHKSFSVSVESKEVLFDGSTGTKLVMTIPGEGKTVVGTFNGKNVMAILGQKSGNIVSVFKDDIEMIYDEGRFVLPYNETTGIAICLPGSTEGSFTVLDFYNISEAVRANGMLSGAHVVSATDTRDYNCGFYFEEKSFNEGERQLAIYGLGGFNGHPSMFIENGEATFYSQTAGEIYYDSSYYDVYIITTPDGQNVSQKVVGTVTEDGAVATAKFDNIIFYVLGLQAVYFSLYNPTITIDGSVAGIEDIAADRDNSEAPTVYYNLQGQIVKEPAAGQVVIRREGSDVTKIIVR